MTRNYKSKTQVLFLILIGLSALQACTKPKSEADTRNEDHKAISEVLSEQLKSWNNGSIDGFMAGYHKSDSTLFMTSNGPQYGWETLRLMYHKSFPNREKMGLLTFDLERFHNLGDNSYQVIGKWLVDQKTDKKSGYFTLLFKKIEGNWLIVVDHTFSDK
jgi:ketosteroid isomerase-like protein